ncbi:MAG: hypothetical protein AAB758_02810 [Patescibacteria group bacterium]
MQNYVVMKGGGILSLLRYPIVQPRYNHQRSKDDDIQDVAVSPHI